MDNLAKFYTEDSISKLLVEEIYFSNPRLIVDLGIGKGSLTNAAYSKWGNAIFFATEIDSDQIIKTRNDFPFVNIIKADGLKVDLKEKLQSIVNNVDIAICNPPYLRIAKYNNTYNELFEKSGLENCINLKWFTSDLVFLAQNILLLKDGGILGIILPDGLVSNHEFKLFRQDLIKNHSILSIIQLPDKIFKKTEARTHILIIKKGKSNDTYNVNLYNADKNGYINESISVPSPLLNNRMDFNYNKLIIKRQKSPYIVTLKTIGAEIKRGQLTHKELKQLKSNYIHTTSLSHKSKLSLISDIVEGQSSFIFSKENDILLARVGSGCIGKISFVVEGNQLISDCVYRIRVPKKFLNQTWLSLCSESGQIWLKSNAHGVCSRVLSKSDLQNFPIDLT